MLKVINLVKMATSLLVHGAIAYARPFLFRKMLNKDSRNIILKAMSDPVTGAPPASSRVHVGPPPDRCTHQTLNSRSGAVVVSVKRYGNRYGSYKKCTLCLMRWKWVEAQRRWVECPTAQDLRVLANSSAPSQPSSGYSAGSRSSPPGATPKRSAQPPVQIRPTRTLQEELEAEEVDSPSWEHPGDPELYQMSEDNTEVFSEEEEPDL